MSAEYWQYNRLEKNPNVDMDYLHEALNTLSDAPTIVDFTGKSPPPVYMDGNLRKFIESVLVPRDQYRDFDLLFIVWFSTTVPVSTT
jgi:hypothetical protein